MVTLSRQPFLSSLPRLSARPYSTTTDPRLKLQVDHVKSPTDITKELISQRIKQQGYAFIRGGGITDSEKFKAIRPSLFERDSYDYMKHGGIYTGTRADRVEGVYEFVDVSTSFWDMPPHNDLSYRPAMAGRVSIAQFLPAESGGCTPLGDMRLIWIELIDKFRDIMIDLHKYGVMYIKNLPDENNKEKAKLWMKSADIPTWQHSYPNKTKQQVTDLLTQNGETAEWDEDGTLRTTWTIPAFRLHPETGENFFCNQLLGFEGRNFWQWPNKTFNSLPFCDRPTHARIGNGKDLTDDEYIGILDIHKKYAIRAPWEKGDVVVFDNLRMIHSRDSYKGDRRLAIMWGDTIASINKF